MADPTYAGLRLAGNPLGNVSPNAFGSYIANPPSQMTPGYTGTFDYTTISGLEPKDAGLYNFLERSRVISRQQSLEDFERVRQMRSQEAQDAFRMKMMAAIPGQILQGFESAARLSYPAAALEIQSRTPTLLANVYSNNPYANRKWLS